MTDAPDHALEALEALEQILIYARPRARSLSRTATALQASATQASAASACAQRVDFATLESRIPHHRAWGLFVGTAQTAQALGKQWLQLVPADGLPLPRLLRDAAHSPDPSRESDREPDYEIGCDVGLVTATTQKQALRILRALSPLFILLETEARPNSRARFAGILRQRFAETKLVAVGPRPLSGFAFDLYWEPPWGAAELRALLAEVLAMNAAHVMERGPIRLDLLTRTVVTPNGQSRVTPKQCALLHLLLDNHNRVVSRADIMQTIWDTSFMDDTRTLDVHIRWLRECIEPDPSDPIYLHTVRGKGYHLKVEG
ncbi:MAG: winged helix-turn-helix domain-containing protein [Litorilinea sp.]